MLFALAGHEDDLVADERRFMLLAETAARAQGILCALRIADIIEPADAADDTSLHYLFSPNTTVPRRISMPLEETAYSASPGVSR